MLTYRMPNVCLTVKAQHFHCDRFFQCSMRIVTHVNPALHDTLFGFPCGLFREVVECTSTASILPFSPFSWIHCHPNIRLYVSLSRSTSIKQAGPLQLQVYMYAQTIALATSKACFVEMQCKHMPITLIGVDANEIHLCSFVSAHKLFQLIPQVMPPRSVATPRPAAWSAGLTFS